MSQTYTKSPMLIASSPLLQHRLETMSDTELRETGRSRRIALSSPDIGAAQHGDTNGVTQLLLPRQSSTTIKASAAAAAQSQSVPTSRYFQLALLVALAVRNSAMTLTVHHSRAVLKEPYSTMSTIMCAELLKLLVSVVLVFRDRHYNLMASFARLQHITLGSAHMSVPAILYLAQNQLNYVALRVLPSAQYSMIQQLKLLTTAVFCVVLLQKKIQAFQWRALVLLLVGVILVQSSASSLHVSSNTLTAAKAGWWSSMLAVPWTVYTGLLAAALQTVLCGLSGAYTEWRLKGDRSVNLWEQNCQLALHSLLFGVIALVCSESDRSVVRQNGFLYGYSWWTILCILLNGLGGLLVSAILLYMDNIMKNFSGTAAILLTSYVSYFLFDEDIFSIDFMCGTSIIILAMLSYNGDQPVTGNQPHPKAEETPRVTPTNRHLTNGHSNVNTATTHTHAHGHHAIHTTFSSALVGDDDEQL